MRRQRNISIDKKGVSSLFIAIYVFLLAIILISTLFVSLTISKSSLTTYIGTEQERMQESILIGGPGGMQLDGSNVESLLVNNTGSIVVRIKSLYIGQSFRCDPSTFEGDSYIKPGEYLWIQLSGNTDDINYEENKNFYWTVTTERGIRSSERGDFILNGPTDPVQDTSHIRIGPFEIAFEDFHWSVKNPIDWEPGWSIPKGTKNVIFQVNIKNIDDEPLILTENSCFNLVGNDNIPHNRLFWYIRPPVSGYLIIQPGQSIPIIFDRSSLGSSTTPNFDKFQVGSTCINYMILIGYYATVTGNPDYSKPIAQTIPFEAVLST